MHGAVLGWYDVHARPLPWRLPGTSAWGVLVSEVMAQQTPVARIEPVWRAWMARWPTPADLAAASPGEVVAAWGRLGYPRRALRLREAAAAIVAVHAGQVPRIESELRSLPGIGAYTAAATACFAYGVPTTVVDTNIRRVLARLLLGQQYAEPTQTAAETRLAARAKPPRDADAVVWNVAAMELGALVCTARAPRCLQCPVTQWCAWRLAGYPAHDGPARRGQSWEGTDRQARGALLTVLRERHEAASAGEGEDAVRHADLEAAWPAEAQRLRALDSLVADGLVEPLPGGRFRLPA